MKRKKHTFAVVFMALAVAAAIPLGINRSLYVLREDAVDEYYYDQAGYAIYEGIEKRQDAAQNLATLANRYVEKEPGLAALLDELEYRVEASRNAIDLDDSFEKTAAANAAMDQPARALAAALNGTALEEKDRRYPDQLIANMESEQDKIERSSYNSAAKDYNGKLARMKPLALLGSLTTFDEPGAGEAEEAQPGTGTVEAAENGAKETAAGSDGFDEMVDRFADGIASKAEEFADGVDSWAEGFANDMDSWAEGVADNVDAAMEGR